MAALYRATTPDITNYGCRIRPIISGLRVRATHARGRCRRAMTGTGPPRAKPPQLGRTMDANHRERAGNSEQGYNRLTTVYR